VRELGDRAAAEDADAEEAGLFLHEESIGRATSTRFRVAQGIKMYRVVSWYYMVSV
jgi:hypothetical protein